MNMAASAGLTRHEILMLVARLTCVAAIGFFSMRWIINQLDPTRSTKQRAKKKVQTFF
jgi:HAMP domain-containing protein